MNIRTLLNLFKLLLLISFYCFSQSLEKPLQFNISYTGDIMSNVKGGIKQGTQYLGMLNVNAELSTSVAGLWNGGSLYLHCANTHGATPSATHIGDIQVASNIEAGNHTYLQEFWYRHQFGSIELIAGLQDFNIVFANNEESSHYINSSFGAPPTMSLNMPLSIFPLTALGITAVWNFSDQVKFKAAIFEGEPIDFEYNRYNLKWHISKKEGFFTAFESQFIHDGYLRSTYKLGIYRHSSVSVIENDSEVRKPVTGIYADISKTLYSTDNQTLALFIRGGFSPHTYCTNHFYIAGGINYFGLFLSESNDVFSLGVSHLGNRIAEKETAIECSYLFPLSSNIALQPNIQYIINPLGSGIVLPNCFICSLRFCIEL